MYRFIFGFQRLVWWPKWTPASRSCLSVTSGMRKRTSCFYFRLRHPADGPVRRQPVAVERRAYLLAKV